MMPINLKRFQQNGDIHFVTFSCYQRQPYLYSAGAPALLERSLESMRVRYEFRVLGYVVMPEHLHLLVSEPARALLAKAIQAIKLSVSVKSEQRPFWQARYYDFNVVTERKIVEKLDYMHANPVKRGLVDRPNEWPWSSYSHHMTGSMGTVEIESHWTVSRKGHPAKPTSQTRDVGHPVDGSSTEQ